MRAMSKAPKERGISQGIGENLDDLDSALESVGVVPFPKGPTV